tara:strand:- start:1249 stop:1467 length:219 start_codon:yes stop_codon:yes gene_type:complete
MSEHVHCSIDTHCTKSYRKKENITFRSAFVAVATDCFALVVGDRKEGVEIYDEEEGEEDLGWGHKYVNSICT